MHSIHPTATVSKECELGEGVSIGPLCVLSGKIRLGNGVQVLGNSYLTGPLTIGEGTMIYPFACLGFPGQDFKFKIGDPTAGVIIGRNCILREHTTVHAATNNERPTRIGDGVLMMCSSHVGHDATLENRAILVNGAALGGHSVVGEAAIVSAHSGVHQFGRVGRLAFISASVALTTDVPPFCMVAVRNRMVGLNIIGLRRSAMPRDEITVLRDAYRAAFRTFRTREEMIKILAERGKTCPAVEEWHQFVLSKKRAICPGYWRGKDAALADGDAEALVVN